MRNKDVIKTQVNDVFELIKIRLGIDYSDPNKIPEESISEFPYSNVNSMQIPILNVKNKIIDAIDREDALDALKYLYAVKHKLVKIFENKIIVKMSRNNKLFKAPARKLRVYSVIDDKINKLIRLITKNAD